MQLTQNSLGLLSQVSMCSHEQTKVGGAQAACQKLTRHLAATSSCFALAVSRVVQKRKVAQRKTDLLYVTCHPYFLSANTYSGFTVWWFPVADGCAGAGHERGPARRPDVERLRGHHQRAIWSCNVLQRAAE